jgi:hypothetical protein
MSITDIKEQNPIKSDSDCLMFGLQMDHMPLWYVYQQFPQEKTHWGNIGTDTVKIIEDDGMVSGKYFLCAFYPALFIVVIRTRWYHTQEESNHLRMVLPHWSWLCRMKDRHWY